MAADLAPISAFETALLAGLWDGETTRACLVLEPPAGEEAQAEELREELERQAETATVDAGRLGPNELIRRLRDDAAKVLILRGMENWSTEQFAALDVRRTALDLGKFLLFVVDDATAILR